MTPGFSRRMYLDLVFDHKIETWLALHVRAFAPTASAINLVLQ